MANYSIHELLLKIEDTFKEIENKVEEIGFEAEENMEHFIASKEDMARVEKMI